MFCHRSGQIHIRHDISSAQNEIMIDHLLLLDESQRVADRFLLLSYV